MEQKRTKLQMMIMAAMFAAIIGILAQVTIPLPLVPITGQTLAIGLAVTILGKNYGTLSVFIYLLLGAIGVPVYAEFSSGIGILLGPTGGYLLAFLPTAWLMGMIMDKYGYTYYKAIIANIIGMVLTLTIGTIYLKVVGELSWMAAFVGGAAPFIVVGVMKAVLAAAIGIAVRKRLVAANLLNDSVVAS
ncbi:MAG: biotin transporter BioY [Bacillaceae bacterium]